MRILMLSWEYPPYIVGGLGKHIADLVPAMVSPAVELYVVTPHLNGGMATEPVGNHAQIVRVNVIPGNGQESIATVLRANMNMERAAQALANQVGGFDLIHNHDWLTTETAIALKKAWRIPMITTLHSTERGRRQGTLGDDHAQRVHEIEWRLTYEAWHIIVCSHFMANQICAYFETPPDKITVIPNGIYPMPDPFTSMAERRAFRRRFASDDQRIVFYVGRIVYEKGLHVLLNALPQVLAQVPTRLIIAGNGPYLNALKTQARTMGLEQHVLFAGFISDEDRDRLYRVADAATFPSLYEPFGIVALEAFTACCPVVVSQTGGLMEVVRSHETGIAVYPGSAGSLAWGILHTLQHPDWSQARVANALQEAREHFNWPSIAQDTIAVYNKVHTEWQASDWGKESIVQ